MKYLWIGHREAEIFKTGDFFTHSITTWGSGHNSNVSYCEQRKARNTDNVSRNSFILQELIKILNKDKDYRVMFYNQTLAYSLLQTNPELKDYFICLNPPSLLSLLNNKFSTRLWMSEYMPVLEFIVLSGAACKYENLRSYFPDHSSFVIQECTSAGGLGTFLVTEENFTEVLPRLSVSTDYLVSYFASPSFSINAHVLVTNGDIVVFPPSIQIIEKYNNNLVYSGADYVSYSNIDCDYKNKTRELSEKIGLMLRGIGYNGICGIDFLVYNNQVYFVEINPRFQASTLLLNIALSQAGLPSMQELQIKAFTGEPLPMVDHLRQLEVNYSFYKYKKETQDISCQYLNKFSLLVESKETKFLLSDGFCNGDYPDGTYLYQAVWERHISSCGRDGLLHLHPNVPYTYFLAQKSLLTQGPDSIIRLKVALLNQGIRILQNARSQMELSGGYNESVFDSIDILLFGYLRINTPVDINLTSLSPFSIEYLDNEYKLYYYSQEICSVQLEFSKSINGLKTKNNIPYKAVAFISGDRLRIKPESACYFKMNSKGCLFCPGNQVYALNKKVYALPDIMEVIDYCINHEQFRHILIGGGSADPSLDDNRIIPVIEYIRSKTNKPIYLMCLPPNDINYVDKYINAGVNEIAFNIELFDRKLALDYMPGKGQIPLDDYLTKLERASLLIKQKGNVRTMLIAGLENIQNTLTAVELLASRGIQPMISIFRPTPKCRLSYIVQPSNEDMYQLFLKAQGICNQYGLSLGPTCPSCQNNTLAITIR